MTQYIELTKRNIRLYIRDKGAVFFSLLTMLIVLGLMLLFLGDANVRTITDAFANLPQRDPVSDKANAELFVLLWTCGGIISINAVTVTLAVYSTMIKDKTEGKLGAINACPVSKWVIAFSYMTSAFICSVIICALCLAISEIYCIIQGAEPFSVLGHFKLFGMICVNSFTYACIMYFAASLVKTQGAWGSMGTVVGTLVGFLGGIYLPIGALTDSIAALLKCLPVIYGTKAFRSIMMDDITTKLFSGVPEEMRLEILEIMGVDLQISDLYIGNAACAVILAACGIIFLSFGVFFAKKTSK